MSEWESRIKDHRVWGTLQSLGPSIDKALSLEDLDPPAIEALGRLHVVLALCGKRLAGTDPLTIVPSTLEAIAHAFDNQQSQVDAFTGDRDIAHLADANGNADAALLQLQSIPGVQSSEELHKLMDATSSYREAIDSAARNWSERVHTAQRELTDLKSEMDAFEDQTQTTVTEVRNLLETERQRISTQAVEQQKAFAEAQETRSSSYTETLRKTQESLSNTLSEQQGQFSTAQETRSTQFATAQADMQKRFAELTSEYTKRLADHDAGFTKQRDAFSLDVERRITDLDTKYRGDAEKVLKAVNERRSEVEILVGVIASLGVTSGYQKTANNAQKSMWLWQGITVLAMVGLIRFAWVAFIPALKGEFQWSSFAARVFLTITVGVLAAYAGQQADRFFHMEKRNRRLALELAAIDPFIALLPLEEQQKFKLEVGKRSFAQEDADGVAPLAKSPATTIDLLVNTKEGQQLVQTAQSALDLMTKFSKLTGA